jgi:hypothetical protein
VFRNNGKKFDIQEGEVTAIKADKVKVCEAGKLVEKEKSEVPTPYKIGCNGEISAEIWKLIFVSIIPFVQVVCGMAGLFVMEIWSRLWAAKLPKATTPISDTKYPTNSYTPSIQTHRMQTDNGS